MAAPRVWIILVNWNGREVTLDCLASLRRLEHPSFRVLVVDNASSDGSVAAIRASHPEVEVLEMSSNLRFAAGNNAGMAHALAAGAESIVLLNNDTTVAPDFLTLMEERLGADPRAGMVAPKILYHAEPERIWFAGGAISFWTGTMSHPGIRERDRGQFDTARRIDYATGCCLLTTREVIGRAGMLDESFFMYGEDADWCMRVRTCGYDILYEPRARVWHKVSVSSGGHLSAFKMRHKFVSNFRFFARYASWYHWLVFPWMNILVNTVAAARYLLRRPS